MLLFFFNLSPLHFYDSWKRSVNMFYRFEHFHVSFTEVCWFQSLYVWPKNDPMELETSLLFIVKCCCSAEKSVYQQSDVSGWLTPLVWTLINTVNTEYGVIESQNV